MKNSRVFDLICNNLPRQEVIFTNLYRDRFWQTDKYRFKIEAFTNRQRQGSVIILT